MDISFCWVRGEIPLRLCADNNLKIKAVRAHRPPYLYPETTGVCARACLSGRVCVCVHAGVIDGRTECEHRGQEVDPAGEDWGVLCFCHMETQFIPLLPAHSRSTAVYFSLFVWVISWPPPSLSLPLPLSVSLSHTHTSVRPVYAVIFWTRPSLTPDRWG